ncbi:MAG: hypothetical protein GY807_09315 [Gammaproteobacteria bacterium]|nr:hypothetical protein [Gammaproteobacteria bacterium]
MENFPVAKIAPIKGSLTGRDGDASIEIFLDPFELSADGYSEQVDTSIRLDTINIPINPESLEGKEYLFPVNPTPGFIDGSIYFFATHNPVDVKRITFGIIENNALPVELECSWQLEFERTGFRNYESTVKTKIEL